jgi:phage N-6-adenine-methyltransferase
MTKPANDGNWDTPAEFFGACNAVWGPFDLDAAADASNALAPEFITKEQNGLVLPWYGSVWCNPPYTREELKLWVQKGMDYAESGGRIVMLLPGRIDVKWFQDAASQREVTFLLIRGRLSFAGMGPARWPSILMVGGHGHPKGIYTWDWKQVKT